MLMMVQLSPAAAFILPVAIYFAWRTDEKSYWKFFSLLLSCFCSLSMFLAIMEIAG